MVADLVHHGLDVILSPEVEVGVLDIEVVEETIGAAAQNGKVVTRASPATLPPNETGVEFREELVERAGLAAQQVTRGVSRLQKLHDVGLEAMILGAGRTLHPELVVQLGVGHRYEGVNPEHASALAGDMRQ